MSANSAILDIAFGALCAWRENRSGGRAGMQSVLNVLYNRSQKRGTTLYDEAVRPWQFSSLTAKGDPQLTDYPPLSDPNFSLAMTLATSAADGDLNDITDGATSYYAASMPEPPYWAASMTKTVEIEGQIFFR